MTTQRAFEESATISTALVVGFHGDSTPVVQINGHAVTVWDDMGTSDQYAIGDQVPVLINATFPARVELVAEPNDPTRRLGVAGVLAAAGVWWWGSRPVIAAWYAGPSRVTAL